MQKWNFLVLFEFFEMKEMSLQINTQLLRLMKYF